MDPIADMLIRIKNAQAVKGEQIVMPFSKVKFKIAGILKEAGYISEVERKKKPARPGKGEKFEHEYLQLTLKYQDDQGALSGVKIISRPSRRMYIKSKDIKSVRSGHGLAIVSTSKGIMSSNEARKLGLGGEIICEVW
ncbi:MAG: 30S ribosomal protein S8 [Candidatus Yanofskybacteria bacterium]|nr:30S ribosomal protein S8 [Candidatus Yanofskybacteria bacterium]